MGDAALSEPRDPDGPPEETYNCRCLKEEYTLSDLPKELLPQVEGRLTERQRLFLSGVRVVDAGDELPDGLLSEDTEAEIEANKVLARLLDMKVSQAVRIPSGVFGKAFDPQERLKLLQEFEKELLALEERGFGGLAKKLEIVPNVPNDNDSNSMGKTTGNQIAIRVDISDEAFERAVQNSAFKNETNQTKEALIAYTIRHELGHALTPNHEDIPGLFRGNLNPIFRKNFPEIFDRTDAILDQHQRDAEVFTEIFAWFTSSDYPHNDPNHHKRFSETFENALREFIKRHRQ